MYYVPLNLILPSSTYRLQLVAGFFEVRGLLVNVFGSHLGAITAVWARFYGLIDVNAF